MKKIYLSLLSLFMVFSLVACSSNSSADTSTSDETDDSETLENPIVLYDSLEEINEKLKVNIVRPGVMGLTNEAYAIVGDTIAQYMFQVNDVYYTIRAAHNPDGGISGLYVDGKQVEDLVDENGYYETDVYKLVGWYVPVNENDNICYEFVSEDYGALDKETFMNISYEMYTLVMYDEVSQRAYVTVSRTGDNTFYFIVHWSSGALEYTEWTMDCTENDEESIKLTYTNCTKTNVVYKDDGTLDSQTVEYSDGTGYFTIKDGYKIAWDGASEEDCQTCIFSLTY